MDRVQNKNETKIDTMDLKPKKKRWTKKNYLECRTAWYEIHICCKDAQTPIIHIALLKWRLVKSMVYDSAISKDRYGWKSRKIDTSDCKKLIDHIRANSKVEVFFVRALLRVFFPVFWHVFWPNKQKNMQTLAFDGIVFSVRRKRKKNKTEK